MDFLLPLTIIGFLISIFSISEEYKKRNFIFKFNWVDKILLTTFISILVFIIILQNFYIIQENEPIVFTFNCVENYCYNIPYSYALSIIAFILAFIIISYMIIKLNSKKLSQRKKFINNAIDKLNRKRFEELSADLELFHDDLLKSYKRPKVRKFYFLKYLRYFFNKKISKWRKKSKKKNKILSFEDFKKEQKKIYGNFEHILKYLNNNSKKTFIQKLSIFFNKFRIIKNKKNKYCDLVDEFYYELNTNKDFLEFVAENNLNLTFKLLDNNLNYRKEDTWQIIGTYLISHKNSILYKELNAEYSGKTPLLDFLFRKPTECEKWLVWKPIGDYVINYIRDQRKKEVDENNYFEERYDIVKNSSPIYIGIRFFEVMVNEALEKNTADHMFLNYLSFFSEKILKNISYEDDAQGEFYNMYEYYLYEIFSNHNRWIDYISDYDKYMIKFYENGHGPNIVQFAIFSFSYTMKNVFESSKLRDNFKSYLREIFIEAYFHLAQSQKKGMSKYAEYFRDCIRERIVDYNHVDVGFINFLKYPVQNYHVRTIWDRGIHYDSELRDEFIQFLDSLLKKKKSCYLKQIKLNKKL